MIKALMGWPISGLPSIRRAALFPPSFLLLCQGEEINIEAIKKVLRYFLLVLITNSPCIIVILKIAVRVSLGYYNNKTYVDVKEVVRLYILPILPFTRYHDPDTKSWKVATNSIYSSFQFLNFTEVCNFIEFPYLLPGKPILIHTRGLPWYCTVLRYLYVALCYSERGSAKVEEGGHTQPW